MDGDGVKSVVSNGAVLDLILFSFSFLPQIRTQRRMGSQRPSKTGLEFGAYTRGMNSWLLLTNWNFIRDKSYSWNCLKNELLGIGQVRNGVIVGPLAKTWGFSCLVRLVWVYNILWRSQFKTCLGQRSTSSVFGMGQADIPVHSMLFRPHLVVCPPWQPHFKRD